MEKRNAQEYVLEFEKCVDDALSKWKKTTHMENGEVFTLIWEFENSQVIVDVFWADTDERMHVGCRGPRTDQGDTYSGLDKVTTGRALDKIRNFAAWVQHLNRE
jgi:hypothetical protein